MTVLVERLTSLNSGPHALGQSGISRRKDDTLVYTSAPSPISEAIEAPSSGAFSLRQLEHSHWTPTALRRLARTRLYGDPPERPVQSKLRSSLPLRWYKGVAEHEPHAVEAWSSIVDGWLWRRDLGAIAETHFLSERWAYALVSRFLAASSYFLFADDLRAGICAQTHYESGGSGRAFDPDSVGMFAETCQACVLLRGADWEGWVAIEGAR